MQEAGLLDRAPDVTLPTDPPPADPLDNLLAKGDEPGDDGGQDRDPVFDAPDCLPAG